MWIVLAAVVLVLAAVVLLLTFYAYRVTFYAAPRKGDEDQYLIPNDEQYRKDAEKLRQCIRHCRGFHQKSRGRRFL